MRKELRGKLCAYCATEPGTTPDHVFARGFVPVNKRDGLPTVPACEKCNGAKAKLEHYLTAVLPFGGLHADAPEILKTMVPDRLAKNQRLSRELSAGAEQGPEGGVRAVPIDGEKLTKLLRYVTRGLAWHHWPDELTPDHAAKVWTVTRSGQAIAWEMHMSKLNSPSRVTGNLGDGALVYEGARGTDTFHLSIWNLQLMGGAVMRGDNGGGVGDEIAHAIAILGRRDFVERLEL